MRLPLLLVLLLSPEGCAESDVPVRDSGTDAEVAADAAAPDAAADASADRPDASPDAPVPASSCALATDVPESDLPIGGAWEARGDDTEAPNDQHPGCILADEGERIFRVTLPGRADLAARVVDAETDHAVAVSIRATCDDRATESACRRVNDGAGDLEVVERAVPAGETRFVEIDGALGQLGDFLVSIELRDILTLGDDCDRLGRADRCDLGLRCDAGTCVEAICGDGVVDAELGEICDDGNPRSRDGCSDVCQVEPAVCGDGAVGPTEECDDGAREGQDGCDADCIVEAGGSCDTPIDVVHGGAVDADGLVRYEGDSTGDGDDGAGSCGGDGLEDAVFAFVVGADGAATITVEGDGAPWVFVQSPCGGAELGCAAEGEPIALRGRPAGEQLALVVEGEGAYTLSIAPCSNEAVDEVEPNDAFDEAQSIGCVPGTVRASLAAGDDQDYYVFQIFEAGSYRMATDAPNQCGEVDTTLTLYEGDESYVLENDDDPFAGCCCSAITRDLDPGTYYLVAAPLGGFGAGDYDLLIEEE